jgi:hypothetical protein
VGGVLPLLISATDLLLFQEIIRSMAKEYGWLDYPFGRLEWLGEVRIFLFNKRFAEDGRFSLLSKFESMPLVQPGCTFQLVGGPQIRGFVPALVKEFHV